MPEGQEQAPSAEAELRSLCFALHLDAAVVRRFIGDYLRLLEFRLDRIDRDLANGDTPSAVVGLLSLATSSSMVGASGVAETAQQLRHHAAAGNLTAVAEDRTRLVAQARSAHARLAQIESADIGVPA